MSDPGAGPTEASGAADVAGRWFHDLQVVGLAAAAWAGALAARPVPVLAVVGVGLVVARRPRFPVIAVAVAVVVSTLAARGHDGLTPMDEAPFSGVLTLVTDPEATVDDRLRFEATSELGRLLVEVRSPVAVDALRDALAGESAAVRGRIAPLARPSEWTTSRHLRGRLRVESVTAVAPAAVPGRVANAYRRLLDRGATSLSSDHRALLAGLVLGDDRAQPPQLTADFRAAGLTHLLAVSGQNVAFVLTVAGPLLTRLRLWPRLVVALAVVAWFALVTRFEPSVVRAAVVAGVALGARTIGRASGGVRHLAIAVVVLLVADPLLVHSLGFRLSVAASAGVLVLAPRIAAHLRGPRVVREGVAVTTGAQLAVAPVLVPALGPMPLAALPANVAAGPIAGALMVWGLTAGTVAGALGGPIAWLAHRPSALGLGALERVAAVGASLPAGRVDLRHLAVVAGAALLAATRRRAAVASAAVLVAVALAAPVVTRTPPGPVPAGWSATVWIDGPVAVVDLSAGASPVAVLDVLRERRVAAVGLVVSRSARTSIGPVLDAIAARYPVGAVVGPPDLTHPGVVHPPAGTRVRVGRFVVHVDRLGPPLRARIGWHDDGAAGEPTASPVGAGRGPPGGRFAACTWRWVPTPSTSPTAPS